MSLRAKITSAMVGLVLAVGLGGTLHGRVTLGNELRGELIQRGTSAASSISLRSEEALITNDVFTLYETLNAAVVNDRDIRYVFVIDSSDEVRAQTFPSGLPSGLLAANRPSGDETVVVRRLPSDEGPIQDVAYAVLGGRLGTVRMGLSEDRLLQRVDSFTFQLLSLTGGVTVLALLVSTVLATLFTRPLARLAAATRAVGRGDLSQRVTATSGDEVGRVGTAFNAMTEDLSRSRQEIEESNREILRRSQELSTLNAVAASVSQSLELQTVMDAALDNVLPLMTADAGGILLWDERGESLEYRAYRGLSDEFVRGVSGLKLGEGIAGRVAASAGPIVVEDIATDERVNREVVRRSGLHAFASTPLRAKEQIVGVMNVGRRDRRAFDERDVQLLLAIGNQVGVAVENAQLWAELQQKERARTTLLKKVISAQEEERQRIARELHDEMAQGLTALIMGLGRLERAGPEISPGIIGLVDNVKSFAAQALADTRRLILDLRPPVLDDLGLVPAVRMLAETRLEEQGVTVSVSSEGLGDGLPAHLNVTIFRVLQEAISNCARHSRARTVKIRLNSCSGRFQAVVEDDGIGFDPASIVQSTEGGRLGVLGMKERASLLGGSLEVRSRPGQGTSVALDIPMSGGTAGREA
ncbi:MAG: GAF domain-containing protein [Chloroflexi bacterium]|nr:GAF domain-containing protein [Chloroflexota bacterium]